MDVQIDANSGFCWGVVRTVEIAEELLKTRDNVYVLGHIIHNPREIERLEQAGLSTVSIDDFPNLANTGATVLIRAHGEPPATYKEAFKHGIELVDATCPVVTKLQERVRKFYLDDYQVVIFGKKNHAEVLGVRGVCHDNCKVVLNAEEALEQVDITKPTVLFSQTTMDRPGFFKVRDALQEKIADLVVGSMEEIATDFHAKDTICGQVSGRENKLAAFAAERDVMIFVAGRASSNGKVLFNVCKDANPRTHFIESLDELEYTWLDGATKVGISGATSTPHWLMEQVRDTIQQHAAA